MKAVPVALAILFLAVAASGARIYGTVYDSSLSEADRALVIINTSPAQKQVALGGLYSFDVPLGAYELAALRGNYSATDTFTVSSDGSYRIDLVLFEKLSTAELEQLSEELGFSDISQDFLEEQASQNQDWAAYLLLFSLAAVAAIYAFKEKALRHLGKKQTGNAEKDKAEKDKAGKDPFVELSGNEKAKETGSEKAEKNDAQEGAPKKGGAEKGQGVGVGDFPHVIPGKQLSADQKKVVSTIHSYGNRVTQKELRKALPEWSEAKVSIEVTELEDLGFIRKIKKGRGNILRLNQSETS
jgi:uncharacterized membrane protein